MKLIIFSVLIVNLNLSGLYGGIISELEDGVYDIVRKVILTIPKVLSDEIKLNDLKFLLLNTTNRGSEVVLNASDPTELSGTEGEIFFLVHGWLVSLENNPWYDGVTKSLLKQFPDANVVQVGWDVGSTRVYSFATESTESVGKHLAELINRLITNEQIAASKFVCIGHSLGAHICSWVGRFLKENFDTKLPRIVGLDPAGPLFGSISDPKGLKPDDAEVVHVIHTDAGKLGFDGPCGTIDFFPNGGDNQPGCNHISLMNPIKLVELLYCSHYRAFYYFIEAVSAPGSFMAVRCSNEEDLKEGNCNGTEVAMGDLKTTEKGLFYLKTNSEYPYSQQ